MYPHAAASMPKLEERGNIMKRFFSNYKSTLILLGAVVLGAIVGLVWGTGAAVLKPFGTLFLNLMLVIIVPLIFTTIALSIAKMQQPKRLGRIMGSIVVVIIITSLVAVLAGVFATLPVSLVNPADSEQIRQELVTETSDDSAVDTEDNISILDRTVSALTVDDFQSLLTRSNLIALVAFSVMIGASMQMAGEKAVPLVRVLDGINETIVNFIKLIMYYAPIGLGCYMASLVGTFGGEIAVGYAKTFAVYLIVSLLYFFIVYSIYALIAGGKRGFSQFWRHVFPAAVTALATCSSAASIPVNIDSAKKMGVPDDVAETMIPLGTNLHKDGSIIGSVFKVLFLAALFGVEVHTASGVLKVLLVSLVATLLVTAVPIGGGTISEMMILTMMGFPVASLPILTVIATIIDPPATMLNVVGNTSSTLLTARLVDGKEWLKEKSGNPSK